MASGSAAVATAPAIRARAALVSRGLALDGLAGPGASTLRAVVVDPTWVPVSEFETTEEVEIPFPVTHRTDPALDAGQQRVATAGAAGLASRTFLVRYVEGAEAERTLLAEVVVRAPVVRVVVLGTRPRPAPADIDEIIRSAAAKWGADPAQLLRVAWCESRYDPAAYNAASGAAGLFQFMPATWTRNAPRAGLAGASPFDAIAAADTAAMLFSQGQSAQWACR